MKRSLTILNLLLISAAVYSGGSAFYKIAAADQDQSGPSRIIREQDSSSQTQTEARHPMSYYRIISDRDLFNTQSGKETTVEPVNVDTLDKTDLKLRLWGTVTGEKNRTYAVIEEIGKREQGLYRIGDTIQQASVKMILREKVVLNVNGKDEILEIEEIIEGETKRNRRSGSFVTKRDESPEGRAGSANGGGRIRPIRPSPERPQSITLKSSQVKAALENPDEFVQQAKMRPHFENGEPDGVALSNIKPSSIFRKMGLRNGDVISEVDGAGIRSEDDAMRIFESLKSSSALKLQVKRRGSLKTIDYKIE